jgi:hypothetical protein
MPTLPDWFVFVPYKQFTLITRLAPTEAGHWLEEHAAALRPPAEPNGWAYALVDLFAGHPHYTLQVDGSHFRLTPKRMLLRRAIPIVVLGTLEHSTVGVESRVHVRVRYPFYMAAYLIFVLATIVAFIAFLPQWAWMLLLALFLLNYAILMAVFHFQAQQVQKMLSRLLAAPE